MTTAEVIVVCFDRDVTMRWCADVSCELRRQNDGNLVTVTECRTLISHAQRVVSVHQNVGSAMSNPKYEDTTQTMCNIYYSWLYIIYIYMLSIMYKVIYKMTAYDRLCMKWIVKKFVMTKFECFRAYVRLRGPSSRKRSKWRLTMATNNDETKRLIAMLYKETHS